MLELYEGEFPDRFRSVEVTLRHGFDQAPDLRLYLHLHLVDRDVPRAAHPRAVHPRHPQDGETLTIR